MDATIIGQLQELVLRGVADEPRAVEPPRVVGAVEPGQDVSSGLDVEDDPAAVVLVLDPVAVVVEAAEGRRVQATVSQHEAVQVPGVAVAGRLPSPDDLALRREPEEAVRRRRGDDVVRSVPHDIVGVDDVVQPDVAVDAVRVVEEELAAVVLCR